ncbi:MAG: peptidase inhibitor family I36 protein [Nocardioides sp.]|uniref:peptidase inhibitor family I36 protein n=1 Tax=Nocardioides sp. TaxID=35761 RepID=UPI0039E70569
MCIYSSNNYVGEIGDRAAGKGVANINPAYNDQMDSWWNETNSKARWYYDGNGKGTCNNFAPGTRDGNIGVNPSDELSSWATNGYCK